MRYDISKNSRLDSSKGLSLHRHTNESSKTCQNHLWKNAGKYSKLATTSWMLDHKKGQFKNDRKSLEHFHFSITHPPPWLCSSLEDNSLSFECGIQTIGYGGSKIDIIFNELWSSCVRLLEGMTQVFVSPKWILSVQKINSAEDSFGNIVK